jgi:hypothetical protein
MATREVERAAFTNDLIALVKKHRLEYLAGNQPFILAEYLSECLEAYERITAKCRIAKRYGLDERKENGHG